MKLSTISASFAAMLLALSACSGSKNGDIDTDALIAERDSLLVVAQGQDSIVALMADISKSMNNIRAIQGIVTAPNFNSEITNSREDLRQEMALIQQTVAENMQRLADLESRLNVANSNNANLRQAINALRAQIDEQVAEIEQLRSDLQAANIYIDHLNANIDSLNTTVQTTTLERDEARDENVNLTNQLNTCYYVIGSKDELKDHNIIETGFLRRTKIMEGDFEQNYFTQADRRTLHSLPIHSKKAKVLTSQPEDTYTFETGADGTKTLVITNPDRFWATSNYLVIQVD